MTTAPTPVTASASPVAADPYALHAPRPLEPRPMRWTREMYYKLAEDGYFEGRRVELFDGEIIEMPSQGNWHVVVVGKLMDALADVFPRGQFWIRPANPVELPNDSEPEPDIAVVRGTPDDFTAHPTTALLVVEAAESSLSHDRRKANGYAAAGVQDYWIVNIVQLQVEVHRQPVPDPAERFGFKYQSVGVLRPGESIVPVAAPHASIAVSDLLPKQRVAEPGT